MKNLPSKIYALESFQEEYRLLLKKSVRDLFQNIQLEDDNLFSNIDWDYLLSCGSILSHSDIDLQQDAALRIAQTCLESESTQKNQKIAAAIILHKLTNRPALDLAVERDYLPRDFYSEIPLPFVIEQTRRDTEHIIFTKNNEEIYLNKFQKVFYEEIHQNDHVSASAPTSAGKSFILNLFVLEQLHSNTPTRIVYIVPTRALITQVERDLSNALAQSDLHNVYVSSIPQLPEDVRSDQSVVLVFTQERLHWFLNENSNFQIDLLIIDEAQKIGDGGRGVLLQQKIEELIEHLPKIKILFCSAFTDNPEILLTDLGPNVSSKSIAIDYVAVNQNLIWISKAKGSPKEWSVDLCLKDDTIKLGKVLFNSSLSARAKLPVFAYRLGSPEGGNLIYVNGQADAENAAAYLYNLIGEDTIIDDSEINSLIDLAKKIIHPEYALIKVLKRGVAFHYGNMPLIVKDEIEKMFIAGKIKYLVCTSTLLEGVNLPAKSIFIRNPKRGNRQPMTDEDFWNLAGRVGRLRQEFQGNVICIDPNEWHPPRERKRFSITRAVSEISRNSHDLLEYLQANTPRRPQQNDLEYVVSYLYSKFLKQNSLSGMDQDQEVIRALESECKRIKAEIDIPENIIFRNPGISPLAMQNLLEYFRSYDKDVKDLIPVSPEVEDAAKTHYTKIIARISKYLSGDPTGPWAFAMAILVVSWMNGHPLARIINANLKYWEKRKPETKLAQVIRDTMRSIEEYVRFKFAKYSSCYTDILKYYLESEHADLVPRVPELGLWVEFGVSQKTQMSLISIGLSRHTAIELSSYIGKNSLNRLECIEWIRTNDVSILKLPESMKQEVRAIQKKIINNSI